mmetsp:Transcript_11183/g.16746  ORF Transcript_11183/g.16746 Transcript_11183/m.16746 type:complete len:119 (+) Transcript_11183:69-425(+)
MVLLITIGIPINYIEPKIIRDKILEPCYILGIEKIQSLNLKIFVKGGGSISRIYAIRQAVARILLCYFSKYVSFNFKNFIKYKFLKYDKNLLISDPRKPEPKKFGGKGARSRYQKSYR